MRNLKKVLLSLGAAAAIAALATGGTFAVFTDQEAIGGNDIDSGSVEIQLNDSDATTPTPVVTVADMAIGDSKDGTLKVENDGANKASFVLTGGWTGSTVLDDYVKVTITEVGQTTPVVDNVALSTFNGGAGVNVGSLTPTGAGESKSYTIDVSLPSRGSASLDNELQNLAGSQTFTVDATQRDGVDRNTVASPEL